jgi:hypothetical protein
LTVEGERRRIVIVEKERLKTALTSPLGKLRQSSRDCEDLFLTRVVGHECAQQVSGDVFVSGRRELLAEPIETGYVWVLLGWADRLQLIRLARCAKVAPNRDYVPTIL